LVIWVFRRENVRILAERKRCVEAQPKPGDLKTIRSGQAPSAN
jgi:hypothetical protein